MFSFSNKNDVNSIDVNELDNLLPKIKLIDIRESYEFRDISIKGSENIPMRILLSEPEEYLNKSEEYYIICHSGVRSSRMAKGLNRLGFNIINVSGGIASYTGKNIK